MFGTRVTIILTPILCASAKCGCTFGIDEQVRLKRVEDHSVFYCPNGHTNYYTGDNEAERLKREKKRLEDDLYWAKREAARNKQQLTATKGQFTKYRNRVGKGVCPCCSQTFADVASHMATQHPSEISTNDSDYVEPGLKPVREEKGSRSETRRFKANEKIVWRGRQGTFVRYSRNSKQVVVLVEGYSAPAYKPIREIKAAS